MTVAVTSNQTLPVVVFAPPLTDELLEAYESRFSSLPEGETKDILQRCMKCIRLWWSLPESTRKALATYRFRNLNSTREIEVIPLEEEHIKLLWDVTPYPRECEPWKEVLENLPLGTISGGFEKQIGSDGVERLVEKTLNVSDEAKALRATAFHILWHVVELAHDREPLTQDRLVSKD